MQRIAPRIVPAATLAAAAALTTTAFAQPQWIGPLPATPTARYAYASAFDQSRGELVLFGGQDLTQLRNDTFVWSGTGWTLRLTAASPAPRSYAMMVYDGFHKHCYLFGGIGAAGYLSDIWEWDGSSWIQQAATLPEPLANAQICNDTSRGYTLIMGGANASGLRTRMMVWDGSNIITSTVGVSPRQGGAMDYDFARDRLVLFGGLQSNGSYWGDTQEASFVGAPAYYTFTPKSPSIAPTPRANAAMSFARFAGTGSYQSVLYGGRGTSGDNSDTWLWNGSTWSKLVTAYVPQARQQCGLHTLGNGYSLVLFGGISPSGPLDDTWQIDLTVGIPANWNRQMTPDTPPPAQGAAMVFEPQQRRMLMFGGTLDGVTGSAVNALWDGSFWDNFVFGNEPGPRFGHGMAADPSRNKVLLFGGRNNNVDLADLWEWDWNVGWTYRPQAIGPPPRSGHGFVYDAGRRVFVTFGGSSNGATLNDTWEFDNSKWRKVNTAQSPPAMTNVGMCYDLRRARTVLFGRNPVGGAAETWEYDGSSWTKRSPKNVFSGRSGVTLTYDPQRGRSVLYGGWNGSYHYAAIYEWDGNDWTFRSLASSPEARDQQAMGYDEARGRMVMFGGRTVRPGVGARNDLWEYVVAFDKVADGEPGGGLSISTVDIPSVGNPLTLTFPSPFGQALLAFGTAPATKTPLQLGSPPFCSTVQLWSTPLVTVPVGGNPATFFVKVPSSPSMVGAGLLLQGFSRASGACWRATDAYVAIIQQ